MNLQSAYDLWLARKQMDVEVLQELGNLHRCYAGSACVAKALLK